jgi:hypothetical protein
VGQQEEDRRDLRFDLPTTVLDLFLSRQEQEDVALVFGLVDHEDGTDGGLDVVGLGFFGVERLDREGSTGDLEERSFARVGSVAKVLLKLEGVECGRHDDDLEVLSTTSDLM